jgi:hypothetical protein
VLQDCILQSKGKRSTNSVVTAIGWADIDSLDGTSIPRNVDQANRALEANIYRRASLAPFAASLAPAPTLLDERIGADVLRSRHGDPARDDGTEKPLFARRG